jgi:hypothetical protein
MRPSLEIPEEIEVMKEISFTIPEGKEDDDALTSNEDSLEPGNENSGADSRANGSGNIAREGSKATSF